MTIGRLCLVVLAAPLWIGPACKRPAPPTGAAIKDAEPAATASSGSEGSSASDDSSAPLELPRDTTDADIDKADKVTPDLAATTNADADAKAKEADEAQRLETTCRQLLEAYKECRASAAQADGAADAADGGTGAASQGDCSSDEFEKVCKVPPETFEKLAGATRGAKRLNYVAQCTGQFKCVDKVGLGTQEIKSTTHKTNWSYPKTLYAANQLGACRTAIASEAKKSVWSAKREPYLRQYLNKSCNFDPGDKVTFYDAQCACAAYYR